MVSLTIRALEAHDWPALREVRLRALRTEAGLFYSSLSDEEPYDAADWQALIARRGGRMFGVFDGDALVAITGVYTSRDDPTGKTAAFGFSYVEPAYRGRGVSRMLYRARLDWVLAHPQVERVIVSHRASNVASRRAIERHGFRLVGRQPHRWPDGADEDELLYVLEIGRSPRPGRR